MSGLCRLADPVQLTWVNTGMSWNSLSNCIIHLRTLADRRRDIVSARYSINYSAANVSEVGELVNASYAEALAISISAPRRQQLLPRSARLPHHATDRLADCEGRSTTAFETTRLDYLHVAFWIEA